jgi:hypothetical protein
MLRRAGLIMGLTIVVVGLIASLAGYRPGPQPEDAEARIAVITPVIEAVNTAQAHATRCNKGFAALTTSKATPTDAQSRLAQVAPCGPVARAIAEAGYGTLEQVSRGPDGPQKALFLDVAATALATYEAQGDDFDAVHVMLDDAIDAGTAPSELRTIVADQLNTLANDLGTIHDALRDAQASYRAEGE